jgi:hypothetical protein
MGALVYSSIGSATRLLALAISVAIILDGSGAFSLDAFGLTLNQC